MEKNRNLEIFSKIYKPYKITKKNNIYIFNTMDGDYVVKINPKINYKKLYAYLNSRSFNYLPELSIDSRDDMVVLKYQEDVEMDNNQKALDLMDLVSLLHNKTAYFKDVTNDKYKEIYEDIKNNILYIENFYDNYFMSFILEEYSIPSHYLFLRNYSLIYGALKYSLDKLDEWYDRINDKNKQRVVLVHNNLKLDHFIKNSEEYLISWDNYTFDTPVLDLYHFYLNEWENISISEVIKKYINNFNLLDEEIMLFYVLISIPFSLSLNDTEYNNCCNVRRLVNYLNKTSKIVLDS